jgi:hypothetical protein
MSIWRIVEWSPSLGRGAIESPQLGRLPFDGHYGNVHDFRVGEAVHVELERAGASFRVTRIWPENGRFRATVPIPQPAPPLDPVLHERLTAALSALPLCEDYRVRSQGHEAVIIEGSNYGFLHGAMQEIVVRAPRYVELPTRFSLDALRPADQHERDYLTTRIDDLSAQDVAITFVVQADLGGRQARFYFVVGESVTVVQR